MAAEDVRRTRDKLKAAGLEKAEMWVPPAAKDALKLIEDALRGKVGDAALAARVLSRLELTADLIKAAQPAPKQSFSKEEARKLCVVLEQTNKTRPASRKRP